MEEINEKIYCKKCGKELNINQKFCDNCGIENSNEKKSKLQLRNKKGINRTHKVDLLIFCIIIVFLFIGFISNSGNKRTQTSQKQVISYEFESFTSKYKDLTDVKKDEFVQSHKGDLVEWTGYVSNVYNDHVALKYNEDDFISDILCYYDSSEARNFKDLNKGDKITVQGEILDKQITWDLMNGKLIQTY